MCIENHSRKINPFLASHITPNRIKIWLLWVPVWSFFYHTLNIDLDNSDKTRLRFDVFIICYRINKAKNNSFMFLVAAININVVKLTSRCLKNVKLIKKRGDNILQKTNVVRIDRVWERCSLGLHKSWPGLVVAFVCKVSFPNCCFQTAQLKVGIEVLKKDCIEKYLTQRSVHFKPILLTPIMWSQVVKFVTTLTITNELKMVDPCHMHWLYYLLNVLS